MITNDYRMENEYAHKNEDRVTPLFSCKKKKKWNVLKQD